MIEVCKGIDGIMMRESNPKDVDPPWLIAQSYLGLTRHIMIATHTIGTDRESLYLNCLKLGAFYTDMSYSHPIHGDALDEKQIEQSEKLRLAYANYIQDFKGKKWVFYPNAVTLPGNTRGNIFELADGRYMITMTSHDRSMFEQGGFRHDLKLEVHLADVRDIKEALLCSPDYATPENLSLDFEGDDGLILNIPKHRTASIVYLKK